MRHETSSRSNSKTLLLALISGMCGDALLSWLTISEVSFSIFPLIALILAVQMLYQDYLQRQPESEVPLVGIACFFVGAFGHSAFMKAQYPDSGSMMFSVIVVLGLLWWIGKKLGFIGRKN